MAVICAVDIFSKAEWVVINRVRKYKGVHSIADLLLCDGRTVDPWVLTTASSDSSRVFSVERPTRSDFALFRRAVEFLTSPSLILPTSLGPYVAHPHRRDEWFLEEGGAFLYHATSGSSYTRYARDDSARTTRFAATYSQPRPVDGQCPRHMRASVHVSDSLATVRVHSSAPTFTPAPHHRSFLERIRSLPNQSLWRNFVVDGDGSWIYEGLLQNSLIMMSDGSYDPLLADDVCSCAAIISCQRTGQRASVTWVEKSDRYTADNYRAEILGGIALQLIVRTACESKYISPSMRPRFGCDNNGVVRHGNFPRRPLPAKQPQADVLRYYRELVKSAQFRCKMYHVHGHLDEFLSYDEMTPEERLNCDCDKLAGIALHDTVEGGEYISRVLPGEDIVVHVESMKVTGSYERTITRHWGDKLAREHYYKEDIIPRGLFDEVYWDGIERVLGRSAEMFSVWATKQVSGCCGNNHLLHYINGRTVDACPNCGCHPERASHVIFCKDPARSAVFERSVDALVEWMESQRTDPPLTHLLSTYLRGRGNVYMSSLCSSRSIYYDLAEMVDLLGFQGLLEGRIPRLFYTARLDDIKRRRLRKHAGHWCDGLILRLLQITHRQWTFRNGTVHFRGPDGLTQAQQDRLTRRCEELLWTDPSTLLDEDKYLLELDFESLGDGPATAQQAWISEMEAARAAARYESREDINDGIDDQYHSLPSQVDTEGSIRFRRRRRRRSGVIKHSVCLISQIWKRFCSLWPRAVALRLRIRKAVVRYCLLAC